MTIPLRRSRLLLAALLASPALAALPPNPGPGADGLAEVNTPPALQVIARDPGIQLVLHEARLVIKGHGGWQPFLFCSGEGTLFCQAQLNAPPFHSKNKMVYPHLIGSAISRDGGASWTRWTHEENHDDVNNEGGMVQCADGTILFLDTYVMPGAKPDHGIGEVWKSRDDFRTVEGPFFVDFYLPGIKWTGSSDDMGRPHQAARLHRSILEMPNGDLLTTMYSWFGDDAAPCPYIPSMKKTRTVVIRSRDHGATWAYLATAAVDGAVGTEGFGEPVLVRVSQGVHAGRLLCLMRTGRELYGTHSDDSGLTWSHPQPVAFPGVDIYATEQWQATFDPAGAADRIPSDQMFGAEVDPELIEMHNGLLVCGVGIRVPQRGAARNWHVPQNGDYLAFSRDGGDTWSEVVQFRSGLPTTHYMGVRELRPGVLFVVYDDSHWKLPLPGGTMGFQLEVSRADAAAAR